MIGFHRENGKIHCDGIALERIARNLKTPCYLYSRAFFESRLDRLGQAFSGFNLLPCFAMKSNHHPFFLTTLRGRKAPAWGIDVVSGGELSHALKHGFDAKNSVFSGVGKSMAELDLAVANDILLNVESLFELEMIVNSAGNAGKKARVGIRINPDIDAHTHPKITTGTDKNKFGLAVTRLPDALHYIAKKHDSITLEALSVHIGSQLTDLPAWTASCAALVEQADRIHTDNHPALNGRQLKSLDFGGGFPVRYRDEEEVPPIEDFAAALKAVLHNAKTAATRNCTVIIEPGRWVVAECGALLSRVIGVKESFVIIDASMTELVRPAMYEARHDIWVDGETATSSPSRVKFDFAGPVCESSDVMGFDIPCAHQPVQGDLVLILQAGAYGASMASTYNMRPLPAEFVVNQDGSLIS
ncbi:MAG: diaminopimelate decarboxylase [Pseudomonadota bacterium]